MDNIVLKAEKRDTKLKTKDLKADAKVAAVVYGFEIEATPIVLDYEAVRKAYLNVGESHVIDLELDGKTVPVLFKQIQLHPVRDTLVHADFYAVDMKSKVETHVPLVYVGVSPAVKNDAGVLVKHLDDVVVKCLPDNIPDHIDVDISVLIDFHTSIHVSDLSVPADVEIMTNPDETVANVSAPRAAIEEEPEVVEGEEGETEGGEEAEADAGEGAES